MATKPRKTKSQMGADGERKLASGAGRNPKSGGEAKKPPTGKPKREPVRGTGMSGTSKRPKTPPPAAAAADRPRRSNA